MLSRLALQTAGDFIPAGAVCVLRAAFLTYAWILLVRRHLKEVLTMLFDRYYLLSIGY